MELKPIISGSKEERYKQIIECAKSLIAEETDLIANLANICALLKYELGFFWVGFYKVSEGELVLGPFQGPLACTRIPFGKGVCGACYRAKKTILVDNVHEFPDHIACSSLSNSEVVVPVLKNGEVRMLLDIDSTEFSHFDEIDKKHLEELCSLISKQLA